MSAFAAIRVGVKTSFQLLLLAVFAALLAGCPPNGGEGEGEGEGEGQVEGEGEGQTEGEVPPPTAWAPGLVVDVVEVMFPADNRPEIVFELLDGDGNRISQSELTDARIILAYLEEPDAGSTARYVSYTTSLENPDGQPDTGDEAVQASYDTARLGGITRNSDGTFTYKFARAITGYNPALSHQVSGQFSRFFIVDGETYIFNLAESFVPAGGEPETRAIVNTESCNTCHTRLAVHGGARREVQLCIMCHNGQTSDAQSGNELDFATMIHKIHHGANLPSVQDGVAYQIIGFGGSVHDYSNVHFPQDIRECQVCHKDAPQSDFHLTRPTLQGCASCHDRTWFGSPDAVPDGFMMHTGGQQPSNALCSLCHTPTGPSPAPITEAHLRPVESAQAPGLEFSILDLDTTLVEGGHQLSIVFEITRKTGDRISDISFLNAVGSTVAYPAPEYETALRETIHSATGQPTGTLTPNDDGTFTYTFRALLPDLDTTFSVAMDGRISFQFREQTFNQGTSDNALRFFTLDASAPSARRAVVDEAKCNACHGEVRAHGESRVGVGLCIMCHNTNATDAARRPAEQFPPETVNFKDMIHAIHAGADLESGYTVYGFGGTAHDFGELHFPGLVQQCSICHLDGTYEVPLPEEARPTTIAAGGELFDSILPERAACTSCHDSLLSNVHAILASDPETGVESCAVCHGADSSFDVELMHALAP